MKNKIKKEMPGILFSIPALLIIITFYIYPLIKTMVYSVTFTNEHGKIVEMAWLENFYELFTD
ncbi:MAG: hypothetical protein RR421_01945, partial [Cetobacterium sp.]